MIKRANLGLMVVVVLVVLIGAGSAAADLTDGLVAHWKLDGDANDSAGSNDGPLLTAQSGQQARLAGHWSSMGLMIMFLCQTMLLQQQSSRFRGGPTSLD